MRFALRAVATLACIAAGEAALLACPICFRMEDGPVAAGVRAAVFVLLGVTAGVLTGFGVWIVRFVKRAGDA
jgi:hypothetical protein